MQDRPDADPDGLGVDEPAAGGTRPVLSPLRTGLRGRCPRCGKGHLFQGFLALAKRCEVCGLDYAFADPADGPAFFVLCFGTVPAVFMALWIDAVYAAPVWVHLLTTLPFLLATCILPLRPLKGWLVSSQYVYKAEQGRLERAPADGRGTDSP